MLHLEKITVVLKVFLYVKKIENIQRFFLQLSLNLKLF